LGPNLLHLNGHRGAFEEARQGSPQKDARHAKAVEIVGVKLRSQRLAQR
jgi:hypothetical protein